MAYTYIPYSKCGRTNAAYDIMKECLIMKIPYKSIKVLLASSWRRQTRGQLKTWATTIKADLEPL